MISFLRFLGVANAAVWFGAAIFATFFAGPAFFSDRMIHALADQRYYAGAAAQVFLGKYFLLHYICGSLAVVHLLAEWLYLGRRLTRFTLGLLAIIAALALFGGVWMQPQLHGLHQTMYRGATTEERDTAAKSFRAWHGASQAANLFVTIGLLVYFWRLTHPRRLRDVSEL
ncbi:MAG: DUF4149 domain-containing protein [Verrucomicrobia bacterium]|nr:DUF4149 domain-containing protein [Verrucomicrobiota bacterium]